MPRLLRWLLALPAIAGVLLAAWGLLFFGRLRLGLALLGVALVYPVLCWAAVRRPALQTIAKWLGRGLFAVSFGALTVLAALAHFIAPTTISLLLASVATAFTLERFVRTRPPLGALPLLIAFAVVLPRWHPALVAWPLVALAAFASWRWRPHWTPRGPRWFLLLWGAAGLAILLPFWAGRPTTTVAQVLAQPGVKLVYDATNSSGKLFPALGPEPRFARPDCDERTLVGTRHGSYGLYRLDDNGPRGADLGPVSDTIVLDCRGRRIVAGEANRPYLKFFDHETLALQPAESLILRQFNHVSRVEFAPALNQLFAAGDDTRDVFVRDLATASTSYLPTPGFASDFAVLPEGEQLIVSSWGGRLYSYRWAGASTSLAAETSLRDLALFLTADPDGRTLWIAAPLRGELIKFSAADHRPVARANLGAGVHFATVDAASNTVYVGNFITGELTAVDRATLRVKQRWQLGERLRSANVFPRTRRLIAASALGLFEIPLPLPAGLPPA